MAETRILLLRHAETADPHRFHGAESDIGLGERGERQAVAVALFLKDERPSALYSSAMRRALETANPIAEACGLTVRVEPDLHERRMGSLSGLKREDGLHHYHEAKSRWMAGELDYTHEGGESFAAIRGRVLPVFDRIASAGSGGTTVIVAHGVVIRVLLTSLLDGYGPADFDRLAIDNTGINDLFHDGRRWEARALNRRVHSEYETFAW